MNEEHTFRTSLDGKEFTVSTGKLAGQAGGAVTVRQGDSVLLATATMSKETREGIGFFPLTVDYEERLYAGGRIPGSFFRREGRPTEEAILMARLTDRAIRPLFPKDMRTDRGVDHLGCAVRRPGGRGARFAQRGPLCLQSHLPGF
jgi:polyribonucleotide nucleotidyltransferase